VTPAPSAAPERAPYPDRGDRVMLDGLPGGPWATIVDGLSGDELTLDAPRLGGRLVPLPLRRRFTVAYTQREVPCEVDAELVTAPGPGGAGGYVARLLGDGRRLQRRGAVRVPVHLIARASLGADADARTIGAVTENLSAGGALLRVPLALEAGRTITTRVLCGGDAGAIDIAGRVVRCDRVGSGERPFRAAVAFLDMPRGVEDRLVKFVFERQRELRRRDQGVA
jgi:PilZ domain